MTRINISKSLSAALLAAFSCLSLAVSAGEIYGRVGLNGKVYAGAKVTITCPGFSDTRSSNSSGVYRSNGPGGEQKCSIKVSGASNPVPIITSQGRTRVNLEVRSGQLYRR